MRLAELAALAGGVAAAGAGVALGGSGLASSWRWAVALLPLLLFAFLAPPSVVLHWISTRGQSMARARALKTMLAAFKASTVPHRLIAPPNDGLEGAAVLYDGLDRMFLALGPPPTHHSSSDSEGSQG
jgi:hypothetical protein